MLLLRKLAGLLMGGAIAATSLGAGAADAQPYPYYRHGYHHYRHGYDHYRHQYPNRNYYRPRHHDRHNYGYRPPPGYYR